MAIDLDSVTFFSSSSRCYKRRSITVLPLPITTQGDQPAFEDGAADVSHQLLMMGGFEIARLIQGGLSP
ncbi:hypothetical protein ACR96V_25255 [Pseudomonas aeruginosa]|uniref:hypothetical protein n=1 Tax=Pseudomonas aeruginosa TaxID=287 RepID=UPI0012986F23|nr:hypothetical protein [Pseudomonas aeruginosa]MDI4111587.1 hypothetical protein [Pseudomonas aeruginosa]WHV52612.1 hypothetical protein M2I92_06365 [Pseudomonas aeruginosa]WNZ19369.1 hypothetical protein QJQ47_06570 [Pseudomonas aeruginosa]HBO5587227.1 hypothetical protein [Pseudomonas aeruginosa]